MQVHCTTNEGPPAESQGSAVKRSPREPSSSSQQMRFGLMINSRWIMGLPTFVLTTVLMHWPAICTGSTAPHMARSSNGWRGRRRLEHLYACRENVINPSMTPERMLLRGNVCLIKAFSKCLRCKWKTQFDSHSWTGLLSETKKDLECKLNYSNRWYDFGC